jgi:hypothetical protein
LIFFILCPFKLIQDKGNFMGQKKQSMNHLGELWLMRS